MYNMLMSRRYREFLFYGASRSGKTFVIVYFLIVQCMVYGANCLVLRKTFQSLSDGMLSQTVPAVLKAIATHNKLSSIDVLRVRLTKLLITSDDDKEIMRISKKLDVFNKIVTLYKNSSDTVNKMSSIVSVGYRDWEDRKSTRLNSSHSAKSRMPSSA